MFIIKAHYYLKLITKRSPFKINGDLFYPNNYLSYELRLVNANALLAANHNLELYLTLDEGIESIVRTDSDVSAGMDLGASLSYDDATRFNGLTTELLNAETLGFAITAVLGRTNTLLVGEELQT